MDTVTCPNCGRPIEISEVLKKQVEAKIAAETEARVRKDLEEKNGLEMADLKKTLAEKEEKMADFRKRELQLREEKRQMEESKKELELEVQRRIDEERKKVEETVWQKAQEEHRLKDMEKDKMLQDAMKANEELKRKLEQGSQQTQGEVVELEIESQLRTEFPNDEIRPVPKGIRGGDVVQEVCDRNGRACGLIIWESKNAKWSDSWIAKLKDDQRLVKADLAILLTVNLPEGVKTFGYKDGVWVTNRACAIPLVGALRINLYQVFQAKLSSVGKNEKMERLFGYLTGIEFKQRVEAIVESFSSMKEEIEKEKRFFTTKWAKQDKEISKVFEQTYGMYGDLQGVIGSSLPAIKSLELPETIEENKG